MTARRFTPNGNPIIGRFQPMPADKRRAIFDRAESLELTLDGRPARICGRELDFPYIAPRGRGDLGVCYSWQAVARIVDAGGAFKS